MRREGDDLVLEIFAGLRKVDQGGDYPEVDARLLGSGEPVDLPVEVHPDAAVTRWMGEPHQYHDYGVLTVRIPLRSLSTGSWQVELDMQHSGVRRTGRVAELEGHGSAARTLFVGDRALRWVSGPGGVQLVVSDEQPPAPHGAVVRRFETAPGRLVLEVDAPAGATTALLAPGQTVPGTPDGSQCVFELTTDPWKLGPAPAPTGGYRLSVTADGTELPVTLADEVCDRLPYTEVDELHRKALWRGPHGGLVLRLDPPLADQEAGPWAQHQLQRSYRAVSEPLDSRLVYFQSFLGQSPTDHPAAIQAELHRVLGERGPTGVRMLWAVMDSSTRVPDGAEPVLLRSREWYDALAARRLGGDQHRARPVVHPSRGAGGARDLPRLPVQGDGPGAVAGPWADARTPAADAAAYLGYLEQPAHPDPGDGPPLPRALRLRGSDHLAGLPAPRRAGRRRP